MTDNPKILVSMAQAAKMMDCSRNNFWHRFVLSGLVKPFYSTDRKHPQFFVDDLRAIHVENRRFEIKTPGVDINEIIRQSYFEMGMA